MANSLEDEVDGQPTAVDSDARTSEARRAAARFSIEDLRKRLLDTSARNGLISFKHSERSRNHARVVDTTANFVYAALVDGRALRFKALPSPDDEPPDERTDAFLAALEAARNSDPDYKTAMDALTEDEAVSALAAKIERKLRDNVRADLGLPPRKLPDPKAMGQYARELGIDPSYDLAPQGKDANGDRDDVLQTLLLPDPMERKLSKIRDSARTTEEETGVNPLHVAFGFLEWYESDHSDVPLLSPLVLLPVEMDRKLVRSKYQYSVKSIGDDAEINLTLSERLHRDFAVKLPPFEDAADPESYIERVKLDICRDRKRWRVRRFVTIGHFSFARLAMYHDLDETRWVRAGGLATHPVLADLFGGTRGDGPSFADEHDVDSPEVGEKVPLLILDADSSQHSAIYDAMQAKNLVIEGPPGTGKSQTITNIIAAAMASGQRVLFVAEKMAALHVVKSRLDGVGLGDFCLELHSSKSRKKDVLESLQKRLNRPHLGLKNNVLEAKLRDLKQVRETLTGYVVAMNSPIGNFGATVHDVLWGDRRRRANEGDESRFLDQLPIEGADELSSSEIDLRRSALGQCEAAAVQIRLSYGSVRNHPWHGVKGHSLSPVDFDDVCRLAADTAAKFDRVREVLEDLQACEVPVSGNIGGLWSAAGALSTLPEKTKALDGLFQAIQDPPVHLLTVEWLAACTRYRHVLATLRDKGVHARGLAAGQMADALAPHAEAVARVTSVAGDVSGLAEWSNKLKDQAAVIRDTVGLATEAASLLGGCPADTAHRASTVVRALGVVGDIEDATLAFVTPELVDKENFSTIERAAAECLRLRGESALFGNQFSVGAGLAASEIRRHAAALRNSGVFGFVNPAVRAAGRFFREISREHVRHRKDHMAASMVRLADHLDAVAAFNSSPEYKSSLGRRFQGLATDFARVADVAKWAARVRSEFTGADQMALAIRQALLGADADKLDVLATLARDARVRRLRGILEGVPDIGISLSELADRLEGQAEASLALKDEAERHGIEGWIKVSDLPGIVRLLRAAHESFGGTKPPDGLAATVRGGMPEPDGDLSSVEATLDLGGAVGKLDIPDDLRDALWSRSPLEISGEIRRAAKAVLDAIDTALAEWSKLRTLAHIDEQAFFGSSIEANALSDVVDRVRRAAENPAALGEWVAFLLTKADALTFDLGGLIDLWDRELLKTPLPEAFERLLYRSLARAAFAQHPVLGKVTGLSQSAARERFKRVDREIMTLQVESLADRLAAVVPPPGVSWGRKKEFTQTALIRNEISKQKKHIPLRQLLDRAGAAVMKLKPCFMMSPLSLAQFLKPDGPKFDLLVVDEASQMRPEDAVGAIARCNRAVVVGDPKQLPPTSFFDRLDSDSDDDENNEDRVDAESILDLAMSVFRPARRLRWHYRSRHGSLVAFSNRHFYDNDLIVFPSPLASDGSVGVRFHKVDGLYVNRGNVVEAMAVCRGVVSYMKRHPKRSIGVATMNQVQRDIISDEMDRICAQDPEAEAYRKRWSMTLEPLFIKNLENVQGDERDAIFISTVFGPSAPGKKTVQKFGPINGPGGWRRLNVLFTRAKYAVRLYTSMMPEDVVSGPTSSRGALALRAYLTYAATGQLDAGDPGRREHDSDFELFVSKRLADAGYGTTPQVGVAGYFIDLAVSDPDIPGAYLVGIECDGAAYHSSKSARDRDRLRQEVLEGLGWTIYRIWSTDGFRDPAGETRKLIEFIENKRRSRPIPEPVVDDEERPWTRPEPPAQLPIPLESDGQQRDSSDNDDGEANESLTRDEAREFLVRLREEKILPSANGVDPEACILRTAMINALLKYLPEDEDEFRSEIPLPLREKTDRRQMRYLAEILGVIGRVRE